MNDYLTASNAHLRTVLDRALGLLSDRLGLHLELDPEPALVRRAHDEAVLPVRDVIEDDHAHPWPQVASGDAVCAARVQFLLEHGDHRRDVDHAELDAEGLRP